VNTKHFALALALAAALGASDAAAQTEVVASASITIDQTLYLAVTNPTITFGAPG
jgi:hypothetical protein